MKLESYGILIALRPFNERDAVAHVFTRDFGVLVGMMRGAVVAKKNKPLVGQVGAVSWNARLDSQLGTFHWDSEKNLAAGLLMQPRMLGEMNSTFGLMAVLLPERESYEVLFNDTIDLLGKLNAGDVGAYLNWEIGLLRELGYALDLSRCSGCGAVQDLNWLSPKTGRAVCDACAAPYINKLYKLPLNLNTTCRFLDSVCLQQGIDMPICRKILGMM
jgi:DNA repair protein RecO (recombination protein O)